MRGRKDSSSAAEDNEEISTDSSTRRTTATLGATTRTRTQILTSRTTSWTGVTGETASSPTATTSGSGIIGKNNQTSLPTVRGQEDTVGLHAVLIPTFFGLAIIVSLVFCLVYKSKVKDVWKHVVKPSHGIKNRVKHNFNTLNEVKEGNQPHVDPSVYSVVENQVVVSSLPVNYPNHQQTVELDDSYSALDRKNNTEENKQYDCTEYDMLNHSNRNTVTNSSGNVYSSVNAACVTRQDITLNPYAIYQ